MVRFLIGMIAGVFLGVLVIAPNPLLDAKVRGVWADGWAWLSTVLAAAENIAGQGRDGGEEAGPPPDRQ